VVAVYVDELKEYPVASIKLGAANPRYTGGGRLWAHLTADTEPELHTFAARLRLSRSWVQTRPVIHYDLTPGKRQQAVRLGAVETAARERFGRIAEGLEGA
jgi:hypothetical protein